jgi:hypothetical protein
MLGKPTRLTIFLGLAATGIFLAECALFHFPFGTGLDVLLLVWLTFVIGAIVVLSLQHSFSLELGAHEILSLGCAMGFGVFPMLLGIRHVFGFDHLESPYPAIIDGVITALLVFLLVKIKRIPKEEYKKLFYAINNVWIFAIGALLLFAAYNLQQFHYGADGSIVTHGLFGVDIPFLAGEVHGIRDFGTLRDLHQMGQPWQYHDWTYQLLALLPRDRTLGDLAFVAPLVGYTMLALSIFTLSLRLTSNKYISYVAVALWFFVSGLESGELSSCALSPSFVFGSMIFLNALLVLDLRLKAKERNKQWIFSAILLFLLIELSQTKLSSYLMIMGAMGLLGLIKFSKERKIGILLLLLSFLSFAVVLWQATKPNPLMPGGDFLIGAPLLGYANHVAAMLHIPVSEINPVSHGSAFHWQSFIIIPFFIVHFLRFALIDPKILSAIIVISILRKSLWKESRELVWLLLLLIPLGFLLPILYSPAWYPLALSFYAPLVSVQASLLLTVVGFGVLLQNKNTRLANVGMGLIGLMCLIGVGLQGRAIMRMDVSKPSVVSASLVQTMDYLQSHTHDSDIIATHRFDLDTLGDESYYWYSALSGREVISEGAKYGSLLGAVADTDSEKGLHPVLRAASLLRIRRKFLDTIFSSRDSEHVNTSLEALGISYVLKDSSGHAVISKAPVSRLVDTGDYWWLHSR